MGTKGIRQGVRSRRGAHKPRVKVKAGDDVCAICGRHCFPFQASASRRGVPCDNDCERIAAERAS